MSEVFQQEVPANEQEFLTPDARDIGMFLNNPHSQEGLESFSSLIGRYHQFIFNIALAMLKNAEQADDLRQMVIMKVHEKLSQIKNPTAFSSWLRTLITRMALNELNKKARHVSIDLFQNTFIDEAAPSPLSELQISEDISRLRSAMQDLKVIDRDVLTSFYLEGLSLKRIARVCGIPVGTVKRRLSVARHRLRTLLETKFIHNPQSTLRPGDPLRAVQPELPGSPVSAPEAFRIHRYMSPLSPPNV